MTLPAGISQHKTFDIALLMEDGVAARTTTAGGIVDATAAVIDFTNGATLGSVIPKTPSELHVIVSDTDDASADETYIVTLELSTDSAFSSPVVKETITVPRGTTGRFICPTNNEHNGTFYRYARIKHTVGGTTPSITYVAYLAKNH